MTAPSDSNKDLFDLLIEYHQIVVKTFEKRIAVRDAEISSLKTELEAAKLKSREVEGLSDDERKTEAEEDFLEPETPDLPWAEKIVRKVEEAAALPIPEKVLESAKTPDLPELKARSTSDFDDYKRGKPDQSVLPPYKFYQRNPRTKREKQALPGQACSDCEKWYSHLPLAERQEKLNCVSKHRAQHSRVAPKTPPHYWDIGYWPDSPPIKVVPRLHPLKKRQAVRKIDMETVDDDSSLGTSTSTEPKRAKPAEPN